MTGAIEQTKERVCAAAKRLDRYLLVWFILWAALVWLRAEHVIKTPWLIVAGPLWFPPALFISWRLFKLGMNILIAILWLVFTL